MIADFSLVGLIYIISAMEALKAEMERKRKAVEKTGLVTAEKKYFKRGDLAKKNAEEYLARMRKIKGSGGGGDDRTSKGKEKAKNGQDDDDEESAKKRLASSSLLDDVLGEDFEKHMPGRSEVSRLQKRGTMLPFHCFPVMIVCNVPISLTIIAIPVMVIWARHFFLL